jgi:hypothetical protein
LKGRLFIVGLLVGFGFFLGANVYSYHSAVPPCCDLYAPFGFPFQLGEFGGYAGYTGYNFVGMAGDVIVALAVSAVFAIAFAKWFPIGWNWVRELSSWHVRTRL